MAPYRALSPRGVSYPGAPTVYYAVVTNADRHIGRLLDALDALHLSESTLVVFTGDNGPEDLVVANASHSAAGSPGPFRGRKRSLYEGGVRMPLIVRWKGHTPAGRVDDESVLGAVDLLPTLCLLAARPHRPNFRWTARTSRTRSTAASTVARGRCCGSGASPSPATPSTRAPASPSATATGSSC